MSKILSASQWFRLDDSRRPAPVSFPLSSKDGGELIRSANGTNLRKAVQ